MCSSVIAGIRCKQLRFMVRVKGIDSCGELRFLPSHEKLKLVFEALKII